MPHKRFVVLLCLYVFAVLFTQLTLPVLEGTADEQFHLSYVLYLHAEKRLPDRQTYVTNSTRQESGQPPLTYWIAATALDLLGFKLYVGHLPNDLYDVRNLWFLTYTPNRRTDNINYFFHSENERAFKHPEVVFANRVTRLLSLLLGLIAISLLNGNPCMVWDITIVHR
jgi:hypothetical protein